MRSDMRKMHKIVYRQTTEAQTHIDRYTDIHKYTHIHKQILKRKHVDTQTSHQRHTCQQSVFSTTSERAHTQNQDPITINGHYGLCFPLSLSSLPCSESSLFRLSSFSSPFLSSFSPQFWVPVSSLPFSSSGLFFPSGLSLCLPLFSPQINVTWAIEW